MRRQKSQIPALETFLIGALDMIEAGVPPSEAVCCGAEVEDVPGLALLLGVSSLQELDTMDFDQIREKLQPYAV